MRFLKPLFWLQRSITQAVPGIGPGYLNEPKIWSACMYQRTRLQRGELPTLMRLPTASGVPFVIASSTRTISPLRAAVSIGAWAIFRMANYRKDSSPCRCARYDFSDLLIRLRVVVALTPLRCDCASRTSLRVCNRGSLQGLGEQTRADASITR